MVTKFDHKRHTSEVNRIPTQIIGISNAEKSSNDYKLPFLKDTQSDMKAKNNIFAKAYNSSETKSLSYQDRQFDNSSKFTNYDTVKQNISYANRIKILSALEGDQSPIPEKLPYQDIKRNSENNSNLIKHRTFINKTYKAQAIIQDTLNSLT